MKGLNKMELNTATMLQAVQLWLDANFKEPPVATGISQNADCFRLTIAEPPEAAVPLTPSWRTRRDVYPRDANSRDAIDA